jgi:hypothetical protein
VSQTTSNFGLKILLDIEKLKNMSQFFIAEVTKKIQINWSNYNKEELAERI